MSGEYALAVLHAVSGSRELRGFCTTMAISAPRMAFNSSSGNDNNSRPSNFTEPPTMRAGGRKRPHIDCAVRDFPAPVSPTIPKTSPRLRVRLTLSAHKPHGADCRYREK